MRRRLGELLTSIALVAMVSAVEPPIAQAADEPVARPIQVDQAVLGMSTTIRLEAHDTPAGDPEPLSFSIVEGPAHGTLGTPAPAGCSYVYPS